MSSRFIPEEANLGVDSRMRDNLHKQQEFLLFGHCRTHENDPIDGFQFCPDLAMAAMKETRKHHRHSCLWEMAGPERVNTLDISTCEMHI